MAHLLPKVRAVFFDAVGTLLFPNPSAPVVYAEAARRHGLFLSLDEVRNRFIAAYCREEQVDANASWVTSEEREHQRWRCIVTETLTGVSDPDVCFQHLFDHFALSSSWKVAPDAEVLLRSLTDSGVVLGLGSNYDARLWSILEGFPELALLRDRVVISASVGVRKPGAPFFREVIQLAGCEPGEVLFVGDDLANDYDGATSAGLRAVLLDPHNKHADIPERITRLAELID
ncbi:MAG: HAD family hydrolase [Planctomycetia bacterium]|nr:HAD family hydrolase [Planctomycetia bacterium]